jgi:hypothetical protein
VRRHAPVAVERQDALAPRLPGPPFGLELVERRARRRPLLLRRARRAPRRLEPLLRGPPLGRELLALRQPGLEPLGLRRQRVATLAHPLLREPQAIVAQHARQERRPLGAAQRRHHGQLLLPREVRVEELVAAHAQHALQLVGHLAQRVGQRAPVLVQLGAVEAPHHPVLVPAKAELELHLHARPGLRPQVADRIAIAPRRHIAVNGPRDRLEQRGLARSVRADDPGEPVAERDFGVGVLAEIDETQAVQLHGPASPPASAAASAAADASAR